MQSPAMLLIVGRAFDLKDGTFELSLWLEVKLMKKKNLYIYMKEMHPYPSHRFSTAKDAIYIRCLYFPTTNIMVLVYPNVNPDLRSYHHWILNHQYRQLPFAEQRYMWWVVHIFWVG